MFRAVSLRQVVLLALSFTPLLASAAQYDCTTEFGEAVPLRLTRYENGKLAADVRWNEAVRSDKSLTSKVKTADYGSDFETATFEWRYAKRMGPPFKLEVRCPPAGKCAGMFLNTDDPAALDLDANLFDQRFSYRRGYVQLRLGAREELDLRVRIFKETASNGEPKQILSGSGEHTILSVLPKFILDVGVDEHLKLSKTLTHRLAALEIKIRCSKSGN